MTDKGAKRPPSGGDRRSGADRRNADLPPPGKVDRRRSVESRKPEVVEIEMTNSEWDSLDRGVSPPRK